MSTKLVYPLAFSVVAGNADANNPASNLAIDYPTLLWHSANLTTVYVIIDLGATAQSYDTVALVGSNLRDTDSIRVRTGTTSTGIGSYDSGTLPAYTGSKSAAVTTKSIVSFTARTERYIRIDITATAHPDGYVEAQRLIVGEAITHSPGMDGDAERGFEDRSIITPYAGGELVDKYDSVASWKFTLRWIPDNDWRALYDPLFMMAGNRDAILFIPDDSRPANWQHEVVFGRITSKATAKRSSFEEWLVEVVLTGLAP